jgi:hypothetical protein
VSSCGPKGSRRPSHFAYEDGPELTVFAHARTTTRRRDDTRGFQLVFRVSSPCRRAEFPKRRCNKHELRRVVARMPKGFVASSRRVVVWPEGAVSVYCCRPRFCSSPAVSVGLRVLDEFPDFFHLTQLSIVHRPALLFEHLFERREAGAELFVRLSQRRLRFDAKLPRQVGD